MRISGNQETGGRPLSTADLAAAARPDSPVVESDEPVANKERVRSRGEDRIRRQSADAPGAPAPTDRPPADAAAARSDEALEPLFTPQMAETYRVQWTSIQSGFVDDPRQAVRSGDELVAQVMTNLANTFAEERHRVESQLDETGEGSTENLRVALRRYRSFFERLLSL
jgi:hypothetical protein